jgi:hypothetical protein
MGGDGICQTEGRLARTGETPTIFSVVVGCEDDGDGRDSEKCDSECES